ncbi:predicted protein [Thalassiosira pseudonana CCMP1335]|uniref:EF-hand domain-containing protein n=1 Tax=Thalassiosira pseudonana TaxID=35128 RepID=B8C1D6_THAPS|nr:predicted protein [Thalassiosira pseudonana CCMP1335]EED92759.1 predicted protein [Thalassiosira pseudonana CCMP1335]
MPTRRNSLYQRSSFQGLAILEGDRSLTSSDSTTGETSTTKRLSAIKEKNNRRRRTSSLAQNHQIRDIIAKTVEELSRKGNGVSTTPQSSAEDVLKKVLSNVKESGCSAERIFGLLGSHNKLDNANGEDDEYDPDLISKDSFISGLQQLSKGIHEWDDDELENVVKHFDVNGDGFVSLSEFQHYCYYDVPSVAWRAERQRLENTANGKTTEEESEVGFNLKDIMYSPGAEVHKSSKLFWKIGLSVGIILRYCVDLDIITLQIYDVSTNEDYKTLYVLRKHCVIDQEKLEEASELAVQTSNEKTADGRDLIRKETQWKFISNYLLARLHIAKDENDESGYTPSLIKLHGDTFASLAVEKPANLSAPTKRQPKSSADGKSLDQEFRRRVQSFQRASRSARTSRQSAQELTNLITSALDEIKLEDEKR